MTVTATDCFYLFRDDGLEGPFSPVQLRIMLDRGLADRDDYCQPQNGGPTLVIRDLFDDPETFLLTHSSLSQNFRASDQALDPFASGDVPLMGDTLPIQATSNHFLRTAAPSDSARYRTSHFPQPDSSAVILDATETHPPQSDSVPKTVYHGHPAFLSYTRSIVCAVLAAIAAGIAFPFSPIAALATAGIAFTILIVLSINRSFVDYVVTTKRVEIITGILSRSSNEVKISDIRSINVIKSGFLGFLGIGQVEFASAGGDGVEVSFRDIFGTQRVKKTVRKLQDSL